MDIALLNSIASQFSIDTSNISYKPTSQGYINDTYLVYLNNSPKYILQCINGKVFKNVPGLHHNIEKALLKLNSSDYTQISLLRTQSGEPYFASENSIWRIQTFVEDSIAYNITSNNKLAYEAGRIIGRFHLLLKDETLDDYVDTVPNLNFLPFRITEFKTAVLEANGSLLEVAVNEIEFAKKHLSKFDAFYETNIPERVCHNDTKLNNILFNKENKGLCLIDLDTIMKGFFHYDFGDAVRTIVSETNEDEKDLTKLNFNLELFGSFLDGLKSNGLFLNKTEVKFLPISCALMPFMHGLRALTDYLNGNVHYKVSYKNQNLDRCRSLFKFSSLALINQNVIDSIIEEKLA